MSIVVGGGTGFVGRHFAKHGLGKGYKIINVSRTAGPYKITWQDLERNGLPEDCQAVISMSGEPILQPFKKWTPAFKEVIRESRVDKTRLLNSAITQAAKPPKVFVSLSGVAYYKPDPEKTYTEDDEVAPYDFLSELTRDWEAAASGSGTRTVILRTGVVLGRDGGMVQNISIPFKLGGGGPIGSGRQPLPWVHVADVAGLVWHAVENEAADGVLNATAPGGGSSADFTKAYASALYRPHLVPLPEFAVKTVFGEEAAMLMLDGQKVQPKKALELGYSFKYPDLKSACSELVS